MENNNKNIELAFKVGVLEQNQKKLQGKQEATDEILHEIRSGIGAIKEALLSSKEQEELKNQLLYKDIEGMKTRVEKLEANQRWLVLTVIGEVLGVIFGVIMIFVQKGLG